MNHTMSLLTDLYQLTMIYGYWKNGIADKHAVFQMFFRKNPFQGGYVVAAGLGPVLDYMSNLSFSDADIEYLSTLMGNDGERLFENDFLRFLRESIPELDVYAVPEGTFVFPHEPLLRVHGPLWQCQLVETALLNTINFQSLIATKAARICNAARGEPVLEFGLRRAQGVNGALSASRAAYIGGAAATSNVLAGAEYGIPVKGTHAHSWVMCFDNELEAFRAYADAMPNNCVFLVDTYDTIQGVKNAVKVGLELRGRGHEMIGIRLDSGDLAYLSTEARRILDDGGFPDAKIVASNDLDEHLINSLKGQDAEIRIWGVGTKLATAYDQPALGGVYKLAAIKEGNVYIPKLKLSEQAVKTSNPGILQVRRFLDDDRAAGDMIYDMKSDCETDSIVMVDPMDPTRRKNMDQYKNSCNLLLPAMGHGVSMITDTLDDIRARREEQERLFHSGIRRLENPHQYPVGLEITLHSKKMEMILRHRSGEGF